MIRKIIIFFALVGGVVLAQGQQPTTNDEQEGPQQPTSNPIEIRSPTLDAIQKSIETIATNTAPNNQSKPEQYNRDGETKTLPEFDLDAQESMADSTFWMMLASFGALFISFCALIGLFCNLRQTNKIVKQNRAWIGIDLNGREMPYKEKSNETYATFHTVWKNYSTTPALNVKIEGGYLIDTEEEITKEPLKAVELKCDKLGKIKKQEFGNISPNGLISFKLKINKPDLDAALNRKTEPRKFIFVGLYVSYKIVYGKEIHVTETFTKLETLSIYTKKGSSDKFVKCGYEEIPSRSTIT